MTDGGTVIWRWESDPFGSTAAQEDPDGDLVLFVYNLRFPGQFLDSETGNRCQVYFRSSFLGLPWPFVEYLCWL